MRHRPPFWLLFVPIFLSLCVKPITALPLSVSSRWIIDDFDNSRVRLACVNWVAHLEPLFVEGLSKQPLRNISASIPKMGFNCVRLTWATAMFTNTTIASQTLRQSCTSLHLNKVLNGILLHNPDLVDLPVVEAYKKVVWSLQQAGIMVILDNHVSKPQWCCGETDGNGFWGDMYFDPIVWLKGLCAVASVFDSSSYPNVVAISLRNELRGPRQRVADWYYYVSLGAQIVHSRNPNLLIIISGLNYDTDLHFLQSKQLSLSFRNKLVYEAHWYSFTFGLQFDKGNLNHVCASVINTIMNRTGFVTTVNQSFTAPLFISEFGLDQRGSNVAHNRFLNCFTAFAAGGDFDWAYWPLQGTYHIRNGHEEDEEFYGLLNSDWSAPRNATLLARLQALQQPWQALHSRSQQYQVLFHPATGLCVNKISVNGVQLGSCKETSKWSYTPQGRLTLLHSYFCIGAEGEGKLAKLDVVGVEKNGPWKWVSEAKMQLATEVYGRDEMLCLDGRSPPFLTTQKCICVEDSKCNQGEDPSSQWFKLITTRRRFNSILSMPTTVTTATSK